MVQPRPEDVRIDLDDAVDAAAAFCTPDSPPAAYEQQQQQPQPQQPQQPQVEPARDPAVWHIPRPSLVPPASRGAWRHPAESLSRGSTSSQSSTASTQSAASGTLLLTAANLASLAALHPPRLTRGKQCEETASVASSTHFTVVNGLGRPSGSESKSWCARNHLTVLVCSMSLLFLLGLLAGVLCMELRARSRYE